MREATTSAFNRMGTDPDDERIRTFLLGRAKTIGTHWETRDGVLVELPGLGLTEADILIERDPVSRTGRVRVDYQREIRLKPTDKFEKLEFHAEKSGMLPQ
jgi:hypothetical protein